MDNKQKKGKEIKCPECDSALKFTQELKIGKILECYVCGTENEVISQNPIVLAPLEEEK